MNHHCEDCNTTISLIDAPGCRYCEKLICERCYYKRDAHCAAQADFLAEARQRDYAWSR